MRAPEPSWVSRRFFVPNEDAGVARAALAFCAAPPVSPVFVGGSGMVLLDAVSTLPAARATFVDVSPHQADYFRTLADAVAAAAAPEEVRAWFAATVYPQLAAYHRARGEAYALEDVVRALRDLFRIRLFSCDDALARARAVARQTRVVLADVVVYLAATHHRHDFIHLSNVLDYLPPVRRRALFGACRRHRAPIFLLVTAACPDAEAVRALWRDEGYLEYAGCAALDAGNRGLGSRGLRRPWNRPGRVYLLLPDARAVDRCDAVAALRAAGLAPS